MKSGTRNTKPQLPQDGAKLELRKRDANNLGFKLRICGVATSLFVAVANSPADTITNSAVEASPATPRQFFNVGTQKLRAGKLREAETLLQGALASQDERLQPATLYNLGHARFAQGSEELKKAAASAPPAARRQTATQLGDEAIGLADEAMTSQDVQKMVAAYVRGRGARRELKAATDAVRHAMETYGTALAKWQRASGDFKGAVELNPSNTNAEHNADVVDRSIAKLVDRLSDMQQIATAMSSQCTKLSEKLQQLKGRIPDGQRPGDTGEGEDEDFPFGPQPGQQEGPSREGEEMPMSPDQAAWLLDGFKLGGDRRLPMFQGEPGRPKDRSRPTW